MGAWPCGNLQDVPFCFFYRLFVHMSHWLTFTIALLDFCFACLFRTTSFEVLSESTNRQQSRCNNGSFDLKPLGVDRSWVCDERAALTKLTKKPGLELNTLNQETSCSLMYSPTKSGRMSRGQKLEKAVIVWRSVVWPSEGSFSAPCGSAAADSALLPGGCVVSRLLNGKSRQTDAASQTYTLLKHISQPLFHTD